MTLIVAHRGDPLRHRENTLPSVESAMAAGADWVEVDIKLTRDGVPVLLHDETLTRLWGHDRRVNTLSFEEMAELTRTGRWRIPTLRQALDLVRGSRVRLMIDVPASPEGRAAVDLVVATESVDRVIFAGDPTALGDIRGALPDARIALSWTSPIGPRPSMFRRVRPDYFNQHYRWVTRRLVARTHARGMGVCTFTVDRAPRMIALVKAGVDAIISNDLRALKRCVATC